MERAARVLRKAQRPRSILDDSRTIEAIWPAAVGRTIARHTSRLRLVRTNLVVDAEDAIWQRQLRALEHQMMERIRLLAPDIVIESIEFRVGVPRREPQTAIAASAVVENGPFAATDEADRILDPVLKKVYQLSRRKATA
jgi:predicted nucleic acid-binding Zn ribbon protein